MHYQLHGPLQQEIPIVTGFYRHCRSPTSIVDFCNDRHDHHEKHHGKATEPRSLTAVTVDPKSIFGS